MKVLTLQEFGEDRFIQELKKLDEQNFIGDQRNSDWFTHIAKVYKTKFSEWFFLLDDDKLAAFATIQEFYPGCYRLLTRTYIYPDYRRFRLPDNDQMLSPSLYIFPVQMEYIQQYKTVFVSMQDLKRRKSLERYMQKLGDGWKMHPNMVQTCQTPNDANCWQNVIYKGAELELPSVTIDEWKKI
jgi:hypothetical protein